MEGQLGLSMITSGKVFFYFCFTFQNICTFPELRMKNSITVSTSVDTQALLGTVCWAIMVKISPQETEIMTSMTGTVQRNSMEPGGSAEGK